MKLSNEIEFEVSEIPVSEEQVASFEERIGAKFPADYREFLLAYNGPGKMRPRLQNNDPQDYYLALNLLEVKGLSGVSELDISWFLGFADPLAAYKYGLVEQHEATVNAWRLPSSLIPIAGGTGSAKVFLNLADDLFRGHVMLVGDRAVDRQNKDHDLTSADLVSVANSFTAFVALLKWVKI